jgi:hypothetical protein
MKWLVRLFGFLILLIVILLGVAFTLPEKTEHVRSITLKQTPEVVFTVLSDVQKMADWNRHTKSVELLPPIDGKEATRQTFDNGMTMRIVTTQSLSPTHLVREMSDSNGGPFAGSWSYEIAPTNDGSKVTLTEKSEMKNPLFRLMVYLFGPTKYMDEHLVDLGKKFGEKAAPR